MNDACFCIASESSYIVSNCSEMEYKDKKSEAAKPIITFAASDFYSKNCQILISSASQMTGMTSSGGMERPASHFCTIVSETEHR